MITYEEVRPVIDRMFQKTASVEDHVLYLKFEMQEAMKVLPPEPPCAPDAWHAGACCLRAYASLFQLERLLGQHLKDK
jgi:hypothetical protein